eukprot:scaffold133488_cov39-Cyclotella_meneghiniana.AAC.6
MGVWQDIIGYGTTSEELKAARGCTYVDQHGKRCNRLINLHMNNATVCVNLCLPHFSAKKGGSGIEE